jgi:hypothetical protein
MVSGEVGALDIKVGENIYYIAIIDRPLVCMTTVEALMMHGSSSVYTFKLCWGLRRYIYLHIFISSSIASWSRSNNSS